MQDFKTYLIDTTGDIVRASFTQMRPDQLDAGEMTMRARVWNRLATDLLPRHLESIRHIMPFDRLPGLVEDLSAGRNRGCAVIAMQDTKC